MPLLDSTLRLRCFSGLVLASVLSLLTPPLQAATWQTEITPKPNDNFTKAAFSLWIDDSIPTPMGLLVIAPGWNGDGRGAINDGKWQAFAKANRIGLIGLFLQSDENQQKPPYHTANHGSGSAFLDAIDQLAVKAKRPAVSKLPLLIWGHSAGGQFGYGMACHAPERVLAFAAIKGGFYLSEPAANAIKVPGLFVIGERDEPFRAINITSTFESGRAKGAPWCLVFDADSGHEVGRANELILPFFRGILALKSNTVLPSRHSTDNAGWIGSRSSLEIRRQKGQPPSGSLARTVWLPDETSAKAWQILSRGSN